MKKLPCGPELVCGRAGKEVFIFFETSIRISHRYTTPSAKVPTAAGWALKRRGGNQSYHNPTERRGSWVAKVTSFSSTRPCEKTTLNAPMDAYKEIINTSNDESACLLLNFPAGPVLGRQQRKQPLIWGISQEQRSMGWKGHLTVPKRARCFQGTGRSAIMPKPCLSLKTPLRQRGPPIQSGRHSHGPMFP